MVSHCPLVGKTGRIIFIDYFALVDGFYKRNKKHGDSPQTYIFMLPSVTTAFYEYLPGFRNSMPGNVVLPADMVVWRPVAGRVEAACAADADVSSCVAVRPVTVVGG